MTGFYRFGTGNQLMVNGLIDVLFAAVFRQSNAGERRMQRHIDFVKGQPVFDFIFITGEHRAGVIFKETDGIAAAPATVFFYDAVRHFVMGKRHQRCNTVFCHLIKQSVVECQTRFVRLRFIPLREDTRPGD